MRGHFLLEGGNLNDLVKASTWYQNVAGTVAQIKTTIADWVSKAQQDIAVIEDEADQMAKTGRM